MKNVYRRALATMVGGALAVTAGTSVPAPAMAAAAPHQVMVVLPENFPADTNRADSIQFAGETGFLHRRLSSTPWLWTRYADRKTVVVDGLNGLPLGSLVGVFGDTIQLHDSASGHPISATTRWTLDLATMTWHEIPYAANTYIQRPVGAGALLVIGPDHLPELRHPAADGSYTTTPLTGIPEGTTSALAFAGGDGAAVLRFVTTAGITYGLLDVASGRIAPVPFVGVVNKVVLTTDRIGLLTGTTMRTYSRAGIADGTDTTATTISGLTGGFSGLAGDDLVEMGATTANGARILQRRAPDGTVTPIATAWPNQLVQGPDGVLFVGGPNGSDWAVHKLTGAGDQVVIPLTEPVNAGVTMARGVLRRVSALSWPAEEPTYRLYGYELTPGASAEAGYGGKLPSGVVPCQDGAACVHAVDGGSSRFSYLSSAGQSLTVHVGIGSGQTSLPSAGGTLVDGSSEYLVVNGTNPARQYVVDAIVHKVVSTGPVTGAGLWFTTLWTAGPGKLQPKNLATGSLGTAVATGSACTATDVQATAKHVLWSCGPTGPAGVYDLARKTTRTLPAGQYLLGDNYVVRHDADGTLVRYDLTDGTTATAATFPRGDLTDDRNITWAVDKYSGNIAWVDAANAIHIVDPGVTRSAPAAIGVRFGPPLDYPGSYVAEANLTRPVDSAALTITQLRTGQVVARLTQSATRDRASLVWNGLSAGKRVASGHYRWTLTTTVGGASTSVATGTTTVYCGGLPVLHTYSCSGLPTVLGITKASTGAGTWLTAKPGTAALSPYAGESLSAATAVVPYGDIAKDLRNDLLVRRADGTMRAYLSDLTPTFAGNRTVLIPGNWNRFNQIVHTGDLTGDGVSDLLARETSTGRLFRYTGNGKGGFSSSAAYGGTYKGVSRFVGPGDITGDGKADLILLYGTTMYAWYGNGKGGFTPGLHLIGSGYLGFNTIIGAGDLNEDGKNDLLMRNSAGVLWRKLGNGKGGFGPLQLVGTGYQKYAALY
ncbi:FG-GAP repeat domain-containing protein [Actinoplanes sp. CA-131856]